MSNARFIPPCAINEPIKTYAPGSPERQQLKKALQNLSETPIEIPLIIGGQEIKTGDIAEIRSPSNKSLLLGTYHRAGAEHIQMAIEASLKARNEWASLPWQERAAVFLKAATLLSGQWRMTLNAATMLGQGKNPFQAEIDSACELIDFWNFNVQYMAELYEEQPQSSTGIWNRSQYRPLEGFVFAVTPFNFTAIGGNLPTAPAMMGNAVVWKPASTAVLSAYYIMQILKHAGLPDGVINFIPARGSSMGDLVFSHPELAGIHFTGSTEVFQNMWKTIGNNIHNYKSYPRIVGETGGKDFIIAHPDCDLQALVTASIRGAFEYQGQKCSALSRIYIPKSLWSNYWSLMEKNLAQIKMGDITDFSNFMGPVIDKNSFDRIQSYIEFSKKSEDAKVIWGGECDDSQGYFIQPTVILTKKPDYKTLQEEVFGPVLTCFVYEDNRLQETLELVDKTSIYALTGAIFARNRNDVNMMMNALENAAGNFYINDKPTGAVVGQQPFGGARGSGTNDKAGSKLNLLRWTSVRSIKETFEPPYDFRYPHMTEK